jgi:hypothetical protein
MDFTKFDAVEFSHDGKTHIRLYYQTKDKTIRESSFETGSGWFVRMNGVIATNAKDNSPITATRWENDGKVHVRCHKILKIYALIKFIDPCLLSRRE